MIVYIVLLFVVLTVACGLMAFVKTRRAQSPYAFHGWAKLSLLGRVEFVGAVREISRGGSRHYEVVTVDGRALITQPGAVYTLERIPFADVEREAARVKEQRSAEIAGFANRIRDRDEQINNRGARIGSLRVLMREAAEKLDKTSEARTSIEAALEADDDRESCPF